MALAGERAPLLPSDSVHVEVGDASSIPSIPHKTLLDLRLSEATLTEDGSQVTSELLSSEDAEDDDDKVSGPGASSLASVFNLCNSAIGAGVLSLPFAFSCSGLALGVLLCLAVGLVEGFTLYVLAKFAERYNAHTYGTLVHRALGHKLATLLSVTLWLALWGACIAYLVIIADTFTPLLQLFAGDAYRVRRESVACVVALAIILPLCLPRRLNELTWVSMAALMGFCYTAGVIAVYGVRVGLARDPPMSGVQLFKGGWGWTTAVPLIVTGFNCHGNIVAVTSEIHPRPRMLLSFMPQTPRGFLRRTPSFGPRPRTHKLVGMLGVIMAAMAIIFAGYVVVGMAGYIAYPDTISGNVLLSLPSDDLSVQIARAVIGCVVIGHYPVTHFPGRHCILDLTRPLMGPRGFPVWGEYSITVAFVLSTLLVSLLVSDLEVVLSYIGGSVMSLMVFFLPGLLLINAGMMKGAAEQLQSHASVGSATPHRLSRTSSGWLAAASPAVLESTASRGIKATKAIVFMPSKSWWAGMALVVLSVLLSLPVIMDTGTGLLRLAMWIGQLCRELYAAHSHWL